MKRSNVLVSLVLLTFATAAFSQGNERLVCGTPLKANDSLSWGVFGKSPLPKDLPSVYESLRVVLNEHAPNWTSDVRSSFSGTFEELAAGTFKPADFDLATVVNAASPRPRQVAFASTAREFDLPAQATAEACKEEKARQSRVEAGNFVLLVKRSLKEFTDGAYRAIVERIGTLEGQYDRYLFEGFPMFPWEAWVNSRFLTDKSIANGPPRNMLALIHPSAGMVTSIDSDTSSDAGGVLAVEAVGWIRYSTNYRHWYGASLLAVFPTDRDIGYGVAFNYDNFKLGVTWHDDQDGEHDGLALFFGFDLYQLISDKKKGYEDYIDRLKAVAKPPAN